MTNQAQQPNLGPYETLDLYPVEASIWQRTTKDGKVFYTAQVIRKYKDDTGYHRASSYGLREADGFIQATQWVKEQLATLKKKETV